MKIEQKCNYTIELNREELRDISNALHDALRARLKHKLPTDRYPFNKYLELLETIKETI